MRNAFGVWNLTNDDRRRTMVSFCAYLRDLWENYSRGAWPSHIQHSTSKHSTFPTLLPQIYTFFPTAPRPASKYAILSVSLQPLNNQPLTIRRPPNHLPHTTFPTTKRHLSTHETCPSAPPSLTFRISIPKLSQPERCPTPRAALRSPPFHPPHLASEPLQPRLPALYFTQNSNPTFPPNIFTLRPQSPRLYDPVE